MGIQVTPKVRWVGKVDWELRRFHGEEYSTHRGTTYNSYLVRDEKTALIDTVWQPFAREYVDKLEGEVDLRKISYVVANHGEIDHSGALPELLRRIPGTPVYCTANAVKSLRGQYHEDWNFQTVKTGDRLGLGACELVFVEAPMLHWPDSMMCYLTGENTLFSNDAFGQHYATEKLFNDLVDQEELGAESLKYYANILTPFSSLVERKIQEFLALKLPLDVICTSHGVIWRSNPAQVVERYLKWAASYQENQITVIYDTMWNGTRVMAEEIAKGMAAADPQTTVKLYNCARTDKNDILAELFKSKAIVLGSPTINRGILSSVAALLEGIRGLKFRGKKAATFGAYGWSGESPQLLADALRSAGFEIVSESLKVPWSPSAEGRSACREFGAAVARALG